ncbi:uncharacterized protein N7482_000787 [Penicillium canariense]|uniref:Uncharacterized protein n=1 Tax=Penicillium canariense TaxID=189055 RepID=A0A9W9IF66_9EURO|nr:uncharacterized protein N7482_000787 [Penicillium canariense]KAJ5174910.1 hypothetical protein N7482_000787 [Penicillium canariense]
MAAKRQTGSRQTYRALMDRRYTLGMAVRCTSMCSIRKNFPAQETAMSLRNEQLSIQYEGNLVPLDRASWLPLMGTHSGANAERRLLIVWAQSQGRKGKLSKNLL